MSEASLSNNQRVYDGLLHPDKLPSSCLLCQQGELDEIGHVIPKFVMRWLKRASKKKEFNFNNTQVKVADTLALRILCRKCEDICSVEEKTFAERYFMKYYMNGPPIEISGDVYYFALSIAWRILVSTRLMKGSDNMPKSCGSLEELIKTYLQDRSQSVELDVYVFHADEIFDNLSEESYDANSLRHSIRQGIFTQQLMYNDKFYATLDRVPLVHFKLGVYYFLVSDQNYLQSLTFSKKMEPVKGETKVHILKYSEDLIGFLNLIANGDFHEVSESVIPRNVNYDRVIFRGLAP